MVPRSLRVALNQAPIVQGGVIISNGRADTYPNSGGVFIIGHWRGDSYRRPEKHPEERHPEPNLLNSSGKH